jgi:hypothetical protein
MAHPAARLLTGFFVAAALLVVAALAYTLSQPPPAPPPLPSPNGYDDLMKACRMLADNTSDYGTLNEVDLRILVKTNAEALKLVTTGLSHPCQVPLDSFAAQEPYWTNLAKLKLLAHALAAEGRLAELESRPTDAVEAYLTAIRLGHAMCQGGLVIDSLVGLAIEANGVVRMEKLALTLDAKQYRQAAAVLETCQNQCESLDTVLARERKWARRAYGIKGQIIRLLQYRSMRQVEQGAASKVQAMQARERRLLIDLAARAYELEKNERPKRLADLVPAYLKAIPQDPLTGTNMAYP